MRTLVLASIVIAGLPCAQGQQSIPVDAAVLLAQANSAADEGNWAEAAGLFQQAFSVSTGEPSEEVFSWLIESGDDWVKAGDLFSALEAYVHAGSVASSTGRLSALAVIDLKAEEILDGMGNHEEAAKRERQADTLSLLIKAASYPRTGQGWITCEEHGAVLRCVPASATVAEEWLAVPDVPPGSRQHYFIVDRNGHKRQVSQRDTVKWMLNAAPTEARR